MSGLINPKCQVPIYLTDKLTAISCSRIDSIIFIIILAIILVCCIVFLFYNSTYDKQYTKTEKYNIVFAILFCFLCLSITTLLVSPFIASKNWDGYQEMYNAYSSKGIDPANATMSLQSMQQTNTSADAVRTGAMAIALSNLFR